MLCRTTTTDKLISMTEIIYNRKTVCTLGNKDNSVSTQFERVKETSYTGRSADW